MALSDDDIDELQGDLYDIQKDINQHLECAVSCESREDLLANVEEACKVLEKRYSELREIRTALKKGALP